MVEAHGKLASISRHQMTGPIEGDANVPECSRFTACEFLGRIANINGRARGGPGRKGFRIPARLENAQASRPGAASTHPVRATSPVRTSGAKSRQPHCGLSNVMLLR
jgi:hypothetical protein